MWPFTQYPEHAPSEVDGKEYDYIVVGGGASGCVVASRLSEDPNVSVLVIEKGHVKDNMVSRIPLVSQNFKMSEALQIQNTRWSEPIPGARGRKNRLWATEGIGGGTRINAMIWTRGPPGEYAAWNDMGLSDWSWDKVEPYFRNLENAVAHPASEARGHEGPIEISQYKRPYEWTTYLEKAAQKVGLPVVQDCNTPGAPASGFFTLDTTVNGRGERVSAMKVFLGQELALKRRDRLTVCTGAIVSRLDLDGQKGLVTGAYIRPAKARNSVPRSDFFVKAKREVIICSGAICTPQLLMLSGIGPKGPSKQLDIPLVKEIPTVGATLFDHYSFPIMLEMPKKETLHIMESIWGLWYLLLWIFFGAGLMGTNSTPYSIFTRTTSIDEKTMDIKPKDEDGSNSLDASQPRNIPNIEIMAIPIGSLQTPVNGYSLFTFYSTLTQPHGKGRIELASTDPFAHPRVTLPMLRDEQDLVSTRLAVRFTMRIAEEFQNSGYPYPTPLAFAPGNNSNLLTEWEKAGETSDDDSKTTPGELGRKIDHERSPKVDTTADNQAIGGKTWRNVTDEEIDDYVARVSNTTLHYACTCPMSNDEATGVVDQQLRVYGFKNLRIADASVFPRAPSAHPMAAIMVIAERCAEFITRDWAKAKTE